MKTQPSFHKVCDTILRGLPQRSREVLERRFGLQSGREETLEHIGNDFDITRERVRQIEAVALEKAHRAMGKDSGALTNKIFRGWTAHLKTHGNIRREDLLLNELALSDKKQEPHVRFLLTLGDNFKNIKETDEIHAAWAIDIRDFDTARDTIAALVGILQKEGHTVIDGALFKLYGRHAAHAFSTRALRSYLDLSKEIARGPHGLWGLKRWPEVSPRGLRDLAYLVYKREGKPLHFTDVARLIQDHGLRDPGKSVLPQSVHNDLIRDQRFVLVGRGMYALQEWGYEPGVVRDVMVNILRQEGRPMKKEEVVRSVLGHREVKPATIMLNLQNKQYFTKTEDGKYTLKPKLV